MKQLKHYLQHSPLLDQYHRWQARWATVRHGRPARRLRVIGITGTNGKTTTAHFAAELLEQAGYRVGWITTTDFKIGGHIVKNKLKMTTMAAGRLQHLIRQIADAGADYLVMEVTSHALDQHRVWGIPFEVVVFTNLTHDHLDYHGDMTHYRQAKEKLFNRGAKTAIVNADDPAAEYFLKHKSLQEFTYGVLDEHRLKSAKELVPVPDISATHVRPGREGTEFTLVAPHGTVATTLPIPGRFNVSNVLAAATIALSQGIMPEQLAKFIPNLHPVVGRMERVDCGQLFSVIVDFAHTPDALQKIYDSLRPSAKGKLIAVLGATGRRDKTKRPILGALAGRYCDYVIVTNEDPYDEDPEAIINEVAAGVPRGRPNSRGNDGEGEWWWRVSDRREAIAKAINLAKRGDIVIITGKGGEDVMAIGDKLVPYNDVKVVKDVLAQAAVAN